MKILLTDTFLQSIPTGKEEYVFEKITVFVNEYINQKYNMSDIPLGFSVREIKGNKNNLRIFKLRINKGDRILFTFSPEVLRDEFKKSIIFLEYCHHDKQILTGHTIGINVEKIRLLEDEEQFFDYEIDHKYETYYYDPNQMITQVISIESMIEWANQKDEKAVYYLNDEQFECLMLDGAPIFIFGSAGSGKTTINIHKAIQLAHKHLRVGYFTYSNYLVQDAKKLFSKIQTEHELNFSEEQRKKIQFHHFNSYLSHHLKTYQVVTFDQFQKWIIENQPYLLKQCGVSVYDIWKEIRGLIKGVIPKEWISFHVNLNEINIQEAFINDMVRKKLVSRKDSLLVLDAQRIYEAKNNYMDEATILAVNLLHEIIDQYLITSRLISFEIYKTLDAQYCQFEVSQRRIIHDIALKYQEWLNKSHFVDENDLARLFLKEAKEEKIYKFDYLIADEIQDLTEIQIYCLLQLTKNKNNIMFSGDFNQTIRPTFFNTGRIESILKTSNYHLGFKKYLLKRNYRSSKEIVTLANKVVKMRTDLLGVYKDNDYFEEVIRTEHSPIFYLKSTFENKISLFETAIKRHYVAILVANEIEKINLEQMLNCRGMIFTVEEIKGIEKDYIICYNILTTYKKMWEQINSKQTNYHQHRFYFNLLYVALTRARHYLCFVEDDMPQWIKEEIGSEFLMIQQYNEILMKLSEISTDNQFYKEAQKYEKRELFEQAIASYERSGLCDAKQDIKRCTALMLAQSGRFNEAALDLMAIKDYERASHWFLRDLDYLNYLKALIYQGISFEEIVNIFNELNIDVIEFVYNQPKKVSWLKSFNKQIVEHMTKQLTQMDVIMKHIEEMKEKGESNGS